MEEDKNKSLAPPEPTQMSQQRKSILKLFSWLSEIEKSINECLGSINDLKKEFVLNAMDNVIRKLTDEKSSYSKSPKLSIKLERYIRKILCSFRYIYKGFETTDYFWRVTKILAIHTDLELYGSLTSLECDIDIANRIQLFYRIYLQFAEEFTVLEVFIHMKRVSKVHRGTLNLLLRHFLVKRTVKEPVELDDDVFIKYLIVFKKWMAIEELPLDRDDVRSIFITQAKPKKSLCSNPKYAPYLPAEEDGSATATINNYGQLLDKKFSIQPLLHALEASDKVTVNDQPSTSGIERKSNEVVVLSDDEEDAAELQLLTVKSERRETIDDTMAPVRDGTPDLIDLTDEAFEDAEAPRHYISWLTDLIKRAQVRPTTMDQRLEEATVSNDIIVIDEEDNNSVANKKTAEESQAANIAPVNVATTSTNAPTNSPSTDSGCVLSSREEVGIPSNSNIEMCPSSDEVRVDETKADSQLSEPEQASHGHIENKTDDVHPMECNSFNVSSSDGNTSLPINVASGSISSCSDEAAEQLLTVALKNQKFNDSIDKVQMNKDSTSNRSINKVMEPSDVDCRVESTSLVEATSSDSVPQQSHIPESSTVYRHTQVTSDENLAIDFEKSHNKIGQRAECAAAVECMSDPLDEYNAKMRRSQVKKCVTVVHPTRHRQPFPAESDTEQPQDMTSSSTQKHIKCSIPLSRIKLNSIFMKEIDTRYSPPNYERYERSTQNVIADQSADNSQAVPNSISCRSSLVRRRIVEKFELANENEIIPSTIIERKTYIEKTYKKMKSTGNHNLKNKAPAHFTQPQQQQQQQQHISPSKTTHTQHQPYKLFYSGTESDLGSSKHLGSPLPECMSSFGINENTLQSLPSAFCESDNNLVHNSNVTMKLNGPTSSLPSAIVHPLGLENTDTSPASVNLTTASSSKGELHLRYTPEYMPQIHKELGCHLKTMDYEPENELETKTGIKRLMNDISAENYSPEPNDQNGKVDASLPLKKRRRLPVFSETIIQKEEFDSQPPFELPCSVPSVQRENEIASSSWPLPPATTSMGPNEESQLMPHMDQMYNYVEYAPVRAYSTFTMTSPERTPARFNILPQPAMVINNATTSNVMSAPKSNMPPASGAAWALSNQHFEFEPTFNLIPSQQNLAQTQKIACTVAPPNVVTDSEQHLAPISPENGANEFNVTQYHQAFHSNSPYAATYSIQPTDTNPNSLPPNFDIQNMFNLRNYQRNLQYYHNPLQNSQVNFQETKPIPLNDFVNSNDDGIQESIQQCKQHQPQMQQLHHQAQAQAQVHHQNMMVMRDDDKSMIWRTKAARKMVAESVTVAAISSNDKLSATKSNRVTRSSIRMNRAQNSNTKQKSPRQKTKRH